MSNSKSINVRQAASGLSFLNLLQLILITLKLCGVIHWPWLWVLAPSWMPFAVLFAVLAACGLVLAAIYAAAGIAYGIAWLLTPRV